MRSLLGYGAYPEEDMPVDLERFDKRATKTKHGRVRVCQRTQMGMVLEVLRREGFNLKLLQVLDHLRTGVSGVEWGPGVEHLRLGSGLHLRHVHTRASYHWSNREDLYASKPETHRPNQDHFHGDRLGEQTCQRKFSFRLLLKTVSRHGSSVCPSHCGANTSKTRDVDPHKEGGHSTRHRAFAIKHSILNSTS